MTQPDQSYVVGDRVAFDGWDAYPPVGTSGTVRVVLDARPSQIWDAPYVVRWDTGGEGHYSASMLRVASDEERSE